MDEQKGAEHIAPDSSSSKPPSIHSNPYFLAGSKRKSRLPDWLDHFNSRDLKILFKCSIAAWVYTLFIFINPTLKFIGQATFFGILVIFMAPPSGVIFIGLMAGITIILGACLGWAWGTIAMKAALAARPAADLQSQYQRLQEMNTKNTTNAQQASGQATFTQIAIYNGGMLDARVSVTYFCLIGLFIYLVARIRVAAPKLTLLGIFAMIISDIYLTVAPLIPTFQGTIPRTLILPAAIGIGVSFVCNVLFFPRSTSHLVLDGMQDMMKPMDAFLEASLLNLQNPDDHMEINALRKTKAKVVQAFKAVESDFTFMSLDASVGRWGNDDVKSLHSHLRRVLVMFVGLVQLQISRVEAKLRDDKLEEVVEFINPKLAADVKPGAQHLAKIYDFRERSRHPDSEELLKGSLKALGRAGEDMILVSQQALAAIIQSLRISNTRRWFGRLSVKQFEEVCAKHTAVRDLLRQHKNSFPGRSATDLWNAHRDIFDEEGKLHALKEGSYHPPLGGVMLSLVLEERMYNFTDALDELLSRLVELEAQRTKVRLWLPGNLQEFLPWALERDVSANDMIRRTSTLTSTIEDDEILNAKSSAARSRARAKKDKRDKKDEKKAKKNKEPEPDSAAAQLNEMKVRGVHKRSKWAKLIIGIAHWFSSTEGMYALRVLIVTVALGVPAVIPTSAGFYYREKGLWALIMAQMGMLPYTADFVAGFILRMSGTVLGAVFGLVMWYIGAGDGPGNPYGMAAVSAVFIVIFMWLRLFTSPALMQGIILTVVTMYLVMAYSWVDSHIPSYGNPGVGVRVFWQRLLLVMIGFSAAAFVTFFPRPPSASKHYRRLLSDSLLTIKNRYALLALNCRNPKADLREVAEKTAVNVSEVLLGMEPQLTLLRFELSTSNFTANSIEHICHLCMSLNQIVTQLLIYAPALPEFNKTRFLHITGATEEAFMADVMAVLTIVQQSLKTGDPLPAVLPTPMLVRAMDSAVARTHGDDHVLQLSEDKLATEATRKFCAAMSAFVQFVSLIDELVLVVKSAVGETTWVDMEGGFQVARVASE